MILISVDLPAPLSPSRPSTSPLRRWRLTSRSAVTGPKRLAMCSTRKTSSAAWLGATMCSPANAGSGTARPHAYAAHEHVDRHGDDERDAEPEKKVVGAD